MSIFKDPKGPRKALRRRLEELHRNVAALYGQLDEFERAQLPQVLREMGMDASVVAALESGQQAPPPAVQRPAPATRASAPNPQSRPIAQPPRQTYTPPPRPPIQSPAAVRSSGPAALPMDDVPLM